MAKNIRLSLSDGSHYDGQLIGKPQSTSGELVFTTGMVGYTEAMTDPSYFGQVLVFSYPMIGNYGVADHSQVLAHGFESEKIHASAFVFSEVCANSFHWSHQLELEEWMIQQEVCGIAGVDTRDLICRIRNTGRLYAKIEAGSPNHFWDDETFYDPATDYVLDKVSTTSAHTFGKGPIHIGVIDCGIKWNILRQLITEETTVHLLPHDGRVEEEMHGWVISNGPGDPAQDPKLIDRVQSILGEKRPVLGICLGHQILSLAAGAKTERMSYGHRSHNQPVRLLGSSRGYMSSQNHGFVVKDLPQDWNPWFENVNDGTLEGIRHREHPFFGVQFHPEAAGGPRDTAWIIEDFLEQVREHRP